MRLARISGLPLAFLVPCIVELDRRNAGVTSNYAPALGPDPTPTSTRPAHIE
jgi:hypothetical protein